MSFILKFETHFSLHLFNNFYPTIAATMKNTCLSFFCILLLTLSSCNNQHNSKTENTKNDSVEKYLKLAEDYNLSFNKRDQYNKKAFSFIDIDNGDTTAIGHLFRITRVNIKTKNLEEYKKNSLLQLKYSLKNKDTLSLARYYRLRGSYYKDKSIYDSAFLYYAKSEKFYKKNGSNKNELAYVFYGRSYIQKQYGDYTGAILSANQSLLLLNDSKNYKLIYDALTILGNLEHNLKNYEEAIKYHQRAYKLLLKRNVISINKTYNQLSSTLNNIGNSYREMGHFKQAIYYFNKALKEELKTKLDPEISAYVYNNLGYVYLKQKKYKDLPKLFEKASIIFDSVQNYDECAISNMYLSDYYFQKKDTMRAISFSEKALELAEKTKGSYYYLTILSHAGSVNKVKAPSYIKRYHELNDSLLFQERKARNQFFKIQLETDQIVQEKDTIISKKTLQNSIITIVLSIVILLFIVFRLKAKQRQLQLIQEQQKANEEIYLLMLNQQEKEEKIKVTEKKRIALELHDNVLNKLASTRFNLFAISKNTDKKTIDNALEHINKIQDIENEIRDITHGLNKNLLEEHNSFKFLLLKYIEELNSTYNTKYQIEIDETINWIVVNNTIKLQLYRTIQEAIHNVNKHANASEVSINIILDENNIAMSINDNGIGFDINTTKKGIGLKNMQQRIDAVGGKINIQSTKNIGTSIFISIPIE